MSAVDQLADRYLEAVAALAPLTATIKGVEGYDRSMPDLSPDNYAELARLRHRTLSELDTLTAVDDVDTVTVAAMREQLETEAALHDARADLASLNVIDSPIQHVREVFDVMPTATEDDWQTIAVRLGGVRQSLAGYRTSLQEAAAHGTTPALRQVLAGAKQCGANAGARGFFRTFARHARSDAGELPEPLQRDLRAAATDAAAAYDELGVFLRDEFAGRAQDYDPVGRERYELHSRAFLGTRIDVDETYAWGLEELARIVAEQDATAEKIVPGGSLGDALASLDATDHYTLRGVDELQAWMQETADAAITELAGTQFDIPDLIRRIECMIAPTHEGGIYYTGPSEDLTTRPGRMWWSVPTSVKTFHTWRERSTVYHEGVPGHHLQIAQTAYRSQQLNRWRRMWSWVSGHGEGWALYAERLMAELGYLDDPADYLGMLDAQSMRAARVVLDIGIHCELPAPVEIGGGAWDYDKAWRFLENHCAMAAGFRRFELDRYLGWPGQAASYKVGELFWLELRDEVRQRDGDDWDLKTFHRRALDVGSVGLDALRLGVLALT